MNYQALKTLVQAGQTRACPAPLIKRQKHTESSESAMPKMSMAALQIAMQVATTWRGTILSKIDESPIWTAA